MLFPNKGGDAFFSLVCHLSTQMVHSPGRSEGIEEEGEEGAISRLGLVHWGWTKLFYVSLPVLVVWGTG